MEAPCSKRRLFNFSFPAIQFQFRRIESASRPQDHNDAVETIRRILNMPDDLDYATAQIALETLVDPSVDQAETSRQLDELTAKALELVAGDSRPAAKLEALRRLLHERGEWNSWRPFGYDHVGYKGPRTKLLSHYFSTRLGNCVSMPILFLILADRLGMEVALARAPSHLFVRYHLPGGRVTNIETTSGALPARDIWIRQTRNVSQRGIDTGFYMRSLTRREGIGAMALTVVEHLMEEKRYHDAIAVAQHLSQNDPTDGFSLAHQGQAYFHILSDEFPDKSQIPWMPLSARRQYAVLLQRNHSTFETARELGWEPADESQMRGIGPCT